MKKTLHPANSRGGGEYGWLSTNYSFSFSDWYDPSRMGFGALRVLNDDRIAPAKGFGAHGHRDMEIITIVTAGTVTHTDNMGNVGKVPAGDVQVMSAGTGVMHSEYNESPNEPLSLFQLWIQPKERGIAPRYEQRHFGLSSNVPGVRELVGPDSLYIHQDAYISHAVVSGTQEYALHDPNNGVYIFVIEGAMEVAGEKLSDRDALGIEEVESTSLTGTGSALIIEVPMV